MKVKKIIYTVLLISWMIIIFLFSHQTGIKSESTSDKLTLKILDTVETITNQPITNEKRNHLIKDFRVIIRKSAHFIAYFILGVLVYLVLSSYSNAISIFYALLFCLVYALSDEIHQMFTTGRSARILDVFIDTFGSGLSIGLCILFNRITTDKKNLRLFHQK